MGRSDGIDRLLIFCAGPKTQRVFYLGLQRLSAVYFIAFLPSVQIEDAVIVLPESSTLFLKDLETRKVYFLDTRYRELWLNCFLCTACVAMRASLEGEKRSDGFDRLPIFRAWTEDAV